MTDRYIALVEVQDGKVKEIAVRMQKAMDEIRDCYDELKELGVVTIKKETTSEG